MRACRLAATVLVASPLLHAAALGAQVTAGQVDTFEGGTTQGWVVGDPSHPAPPTNIATGGPAGAGDNYLQLTAVGGGAAAERGVAARGRYSVAMRRAGQGTVVGSRRHPARARSLDGQPPRGHYSRMTSSSPVVSTADLAARLGDPALRILDASWYLPSAGRDARAEFRAGHLPGARFFDLDRASDHATTLPHMLPSADDFARYAGEELGVGDGDAVVVYDGSGTNLSAARVWWMFRAFGHADVAVLDGGLRRWMAEGRPLESGDAPPPSPARLTATLDARRVRDLDAVRAVAGEGDGVRGPLVVDMRPAGRFAGRDPEPRAGLRGGHVPGSVNLPFTDLARADGTVLPPDELRARLAAAGIALDRPVVATCGSGTSACALLLNLERLGVRDAALYDGSWAEWGGRDDTPLVTGP